MDVSLCKQMPIPETSAGVRVKKVSMTVINMESILLLFCMRVSVTHMHKTRKGCDYAVANVTLPPPNAPDYSYHHCCLFVFIYLYHFFFSFYEVNLIENCAGEKLIKFREIIICIHQYKESLSYNSSF